MKKLLLSFSVLLPSLMMAQAIATTGTEHTPAQLVNSVLLAGSGIQATNITSVTGTNYSSVNGLGYFNKGESQFPFENGIILSTGNIANAPGPSTTIQSAGNVQWIGDTDVTAVMTQVNDGQPGSVSSVNATKLEFDFIATTENFSLNYMFASAEYGNYQCGFTDAFVILLTDLTTGTSTNIAVIPGTATPVSVVTVRNSQYNPACSSVNASYFGSYYGANNLQAPINFTGTTVPMSAQATLVVGHQYHVKVAIADRNDSAFDSAIFIEGGSMDTGEPVFVINEPGDLQTCTFEQGVATYFDLTVNEPVILGTLPPANFTISYYESLEDANNNENALAEPENYLLIDESDTIFVRVSHNTDPSDFAVVDFLIGVFSMSINEPDIYSLCGQDATATFDLTTRDYEILNFCFECTIIYSDENGPIDNPASYTNLTNPQTLAVTVTSEFGCVATTQLELLVTPQMEIASLDISGQDVVVNMSAEGDFIFRVDNINYGNLNSFSDLTIGQHTLQVTDLTCGNTIVMTFNIVPDAPLGETSQEFTEGETLADLDVEGEGIQWYSTPGDAPPSNMDADTPLALSTPLINGTTYYASQTISGAESTQRLAVTAVMILGLKDNALTELRYYPNPVIDMFSISNTAAIDGVVVYNTLGQVVLQQKFDTRDALINMVSLENGIYIVKISSNNQQKTIRIIKQ